MREEQREILVVGRGLEEIYKLRCYLRQGKLQISKRPIQLVETMQIEI